MNSKLHRSALVLNEHFTSVSVSNVYVVLHFFEGFDIDDFTRLVSAIFSCCFLFFFTAMSVTLIELFTDAV